jgi:hypothetical protein
MAQRAYAAWLGDRALCHHARSCAFLCRAELDAKTLPLFMQKWKQWTNKRAMRELKLAASLWQEEFFDHLLRSR